VALWKKLTPFHLLINICHQSKSEQNLLLSLVQKDNCFTLAAVAYILVINVRPGLTTFVACWSRPTKDNISHLVAFFSEAIVVLMCGFALTSPLADELHRRRNRGCWGCFSTPTFVYSFCTYLFLISKLI